jgi:hypothetical protein
MMERWLKFLQNFERRIMPRKKKVEVVSEVVIPAFSVSAKLYDRLKERAREYGVSVEEIILTILGVAMFGGGSSKRFAIQDRTDNPQDVLEKVQAMHKEHMKDYKRLNKRLDKIEEKMAT